MQGHALTMQALTNGHARHNTWVNLSNNQIHCIIPGYFSHPGHYVHHKMLLNENESYVVLVARQILLVTINNTGRNN